VTDTAPGVSVEQLMREVEARARSARRARLARRRGASEYRDAALFEAVDRVLRRAVEDREPDALLLPDLLSDDDDWSLETSLRFSSHRRTLGPLIVFMKRRLLLPVTRWLYEYSLENFRRQQRVNRLLFACVEELAIENARLRQELSALQQKSR
jgi:hypothetical protein